MTVSVDQWRQIYVQIKKNWYWDDSGLDSFSIACPFFSNEGCKDIVLQGTDYVYVVSSYQPGGELVIKPHCVRDKAYN